MKGFKQFIGEVAAIVRTPKTLIPVVGVLLIPVMYSGMFLGAFWDPYGKMDKLPVAVVNSDGGTVSNGEEIKIGREFTDELKKNAKFEWHFVDRQAAEKGLSDHSYYMAIEIPADFSAKTATLTTEHPTPAEIVFLKDEGSNFLASQIGNTAVAQMRTELSQQVTKAYARAVLDQMTELSNGLGDASAGAGELAAGAADAKTGAAKIEENLHKLASGSATMQQGIDKLAAGAADAAKGAQDVRQGSADLSGGLAQLKEAGGQLATGASGVDQGARNLADGLQASSDGAAKLQGGAEKLSAGLAQWAAAKPELADDAGFQQLLAAAKQLEAGTADAATGQQKLTAGAVTLSAGASQVAAGLDTFGSKLNDAASGGQKLAAGAEKLQAGSAQLSQGLSQLSGRFAAIADGSSKLDQGAADLSSGLLKLSDGSSRLSDKLGDAAKQTSGLGGDNADSVVDMFADPVNLDVVKTTEVVNYGTGFAPYFLSLGLYVGAMILSIIYSVKQPAVAPKSAWGWFAGKAMTLALIGAVQALIADAVLIWGVGLEVHSLPLFVLFSVATSVMFMFIIQFLVATMENPGRFIAIILLIFQLTSSGGTFPLEMVPGWLQKVGEWLPMTYAVSGFRSIVSTGDYSVLRHDIGVLAIFGILFAALSYAYFAVVYRKGNKAGKGGEAAATA